MGNLNNGALERDGSRRVALVTAAHAASVALVPWAWRRMATISPSFMPAASMRRARRARLRGGWRHGARISM